MTMRCPECSQLALRTHSKSNREDHTVTRRSFCGACNIKFSTTECVAGPIKRNIEPYRKDYTLEELGIAAHMRAQGKCWKLVARALDCKESSLKQAYYKAKNAAL